MPLAAITYQTVVDSVKNWIKTNCVNVANYAGMPACFKSGYSASVQIAGNGTVNTNNTISISANGAVQVTTGTVDTEMTAFLTTVGINSRLSSTLAEAEYFNVINDMVTFCYTKVCYLVSQYDSTPRLIYQTGNQTYSSIKMVNGLTGGKIIDTITINDILNTLLNVINQNIKTKACRYNIGFS